MRRKREMISAVATVASADAVTVTSPNVDGWSHARGDATLTQTPYAN